MNKINHQLAIGAPNSPIRHQLAERICVKCLEDERGKLPIVSRKAFMIGPVPVTVLAQCYVCESENVYTACVEPINSEVSK